MEQTQIAANVQNTSANDQLTAIQSQIGGQTQQAEIAANVANTTTQAQVQENADNLASVLGIVQGQNQLQEDSINAQTEDQYNADAAAVDISGQQYSYLTNNANDATAVSLTGLQDQTQLASQQETNTAAATNTLLGQLGKGTGDYSQTIASLIASLNGSPTGAVAEANLGGANENEQFATSAGPVTSGIVGTIGQALTGLFA